ncbi:hypothetical protein VTN77DRAFT_1260 [Rasamsonia byssochlamydoides]|uniref:uncharacterized protein n=1 Tax=Rasamsonia byssochlamydoides TaxID=89139 RepID=UPI003743865E
MEHVLPFFESAERIHLTVSSLESLWMLFTNLLKDPSLGTLFCVLDDLDECDKDSTRSLVTKFAKFFSSRPTGAELKMMIFSRETSGPRIFPQLNIDQNFSKEVTGDVERFVSIKLEELSRINGFTEHLGNHIQQTLLRRAQGTFLWLGPIMNDLLQKKTCTEVLETIKLLPVELSTMYGRMLLQVDRRRREAASQILRWVAMARRPLTLHELAASIDIEPSPPLSCEQAIRDYISLCELFLTIQEDEVRLIHPSAKAYLLRENPDSNQTLEKYFRICMYCTYNLGQILESDSK